MHPQLEEIVTEFERGSLRLHRLVQSMAAERWSARPAADRWSASECIAHLNLTAAAFRPLVERALNDARRLAASGPGRRTPERYRRGLIGGLLWKVLSKPGRFRTKTAPAFVPGALEPADRVVGEFDRLQDEQIGWVRAADGLPIGDVKVASPFDSRVRYNLFAALSILARHQHRHLAQAENAAGSA
jgi:hypothetical protein